ncbi:hypothetical protein [Paenibacillus spongiae]|uniref:ParA family protein n=1 Tax=Paenibacillus spongiae TaxID=2909671 RepID=A0ABY5SCQ5_9BACL|nr:hypothetical protein [Paenibacillus spongiae]UVI31310.1 hypothetical protein L1F29_05560 [Paenibacillus spongiae]
MSAPAPLLAIVGTTPNIGTTVAAFALAYRLASQGTGSVGYLCLNLKSAKTHRYLGNDKPETMLDSLRPELATGSLNTDKLLHAMQAVSGNESLKVLFGNMMRDQAEYFTPPEIEHLLDTAQRTFDIVIADVGAYWDNAATVCALRRADARLLVTTPALSHFQEDGRRWMKQMSPLFGIPGDAYELIVIHPPHRTCVYQTKDICKEMDVTLMGELRLSEKLLPQLDSGTIDEWLAYDEQGKQAMTEPAQRIMKRYGLQRRPVMAVQPWYKKLMTHRGGRIS